MLYVCYIPSTQALRYTNRVCHYLVKLCRYVMTHHGFMACNVVGDSPVILIQMLMWSTSWSHVTINTIIQIICLWY